MFTLFLALYSTISSVSPEVKTNAQKRSTFHLIAHKVLDSQWKKRYFWMVPEPLVQQFKKKRWGSGDENDLASPAHSSAHAPILWAGNSRPQSPNVFFVFFFFLRSNRWPKDRRLWERGWPHRSLRTGFPARSDGESAPGSLFAG